MHSLIQLVVANEVLTLSQVHEYLGELVWVIIVKLYGLCESRLQSWVCCNEIPHVVGISSHNAYKLAPVVFKSFKQGVDSFLSERIVISRHESVCLIDEEYSSECSINKLVCFYCCLSCKSCHEFASVCFHELATAHQSERFEHLCHDACHSCFTSSWITCKHIMLCAHLVFVATFELQVYHGSKV